MAAVTTAIVGAAVGAASLAHTVETGAEGKRQAGQAKEAANFEADRAEKELKTQEKEKAGKKKASQQRQAASNRQRAIASEKQGRQGTIIGGAPGGEGSGAQSLGGGKGKSLLGV